MTNTKWHSVLDDKRRKKGIEIVRLIAERFRDDELLVEAIASCTDRNEFFYWEGDGRLGHLLFFEYLAQCTKDKEYKKHFDKLLAEHLSQPGWLANSPLSLSSGLSGVALAVECASDNGRNYQRVLFGIDSALAARIDSILSTVERYQDHCALPDYDAISGLAGIGTYLLMRPDGADNRAQIERILKVLIDLSQSVNGIPKYKTPRNLLDKWFAADERFQHGLLNLGLSHGIPGPLMTLSLAKLNGFVSEGLDTALETLADILIKTAQRDEWGINWASAVPLSEDQNSFVMGPLYTRTAWCYGSPGVASALYTAGRALENSTYKKFAVDSMRDAVARPTKYRCLEGSAFCHGRAGLLQVLLRFHNATHDQIFAEAATQIFDEIVNLFSPEFAFGFKNYHKESMDGDDDPRLFDGAAGTALVLAAAVFDVEPRFDRIFLLS